MRFLSSFLGTLLASMVFKYRRLVLVGLISAGGVIQTAFKNPRDFYCKNLHGKTYLGVKIVKVDSCKPKRSK